MSDNIAPTLDLEEEEDRIIRASLSDYEKFQLVYAKCKRLRKEFTVFIDLTKSSKVWKYFGVLKYKGETIMKKKYFCQLCLNPPNSTTENEQNQDQVKDEATIAPRGEKIGIFKRYHCIIYIFSQRQVIVTNKNNLEQIFGI